MSVSYIKNQVPHHCDHDDNKTQSIVIDNADHMIKAGFSGDRKPSIQFPAIIGYPKKLGGLGTKDIYFGYEAERKSRSVLTLS